MQSYPVHLGGLPCDIDAILAIARRHGLRVIEVAAHAIGSHCHGSPIGAWESSGRARSNAIADSFYATKNLTTGEGGMVTTHEPGLDERIRLLCLHGINQCPNALDLYPRLVSLPLYPAMTAQQVLWVAESVRRSSGPQERARWSDWRLPPATWHQV